MSNIPMLLDLRTLRLRSQAALSTGDYRKDPTATQYEYNMHATSTILQ